MNIKELIKKYEDIYEDYKEKIDLNYRLGNDEKVDFWISKIDVVMGILQDLKKLKVGDR